MSLKRPPYEVVSIITQSLDLEDIFHLALSCRHFQYLIYDDRRCKVFLDTLAPATPEAQEARSTSNYARAFRRLVKRRQAIRTAAPFTAAIVAVAESWLYTGGVLCYFLERTLRVLDLHRAASTETVLDVWGLLREAVGGEARQRQRYKKLQLLHYDAGLVTCLYTRARTSWLVVVDVARQRLVTTSPALESTNKIFVRNDAHFLYFGTHSEVGEDGHRRWVLMSYNVQCDKWLESKIHLMDLVGSDIGQSVCFEIIDGKFYGLSTQTSFEVDEADWTSYYHCFRFPVSNPRAKDTERSDRERMWRRQHADGPIDDRWSFLRLTKNEATGKPQILESRKEWLNRSSSGQRTYYTTDLHFAPPKVEEDNDSEALAGGAITPTTNNTNATTDSGYGGTSSSNSNSMPPDSAHLALSPLVRTNFILPTTTTTRPRDPHNTHLGDDASTALLFTFSKCPVRSYHLPSQAFLDLVDDPAPSATDSVARLRLRAGARHLAPASALPQDDAQLPHTERTRRLYRDGGANEIVFWPPEPEPCEGGDAGKLEMLGRVINPPAHAGNVAGAWDERSVVYSVGSKEDGPQAVVFVGFDPAMRLWGLQRWGEQQQQPVPDEEATAGGEEASAAAAALSNAGGEFMQEAWDHGPSTAVPGSEDVFEPDCKGKGKEVVASLPDDDFAATWGDTDTTDAESPQSTVGYSSGDDEPLDADAATWSFSSVEDVDNTQEQQLQPQRQEPHSGAWAWVEPAMYHKINCGFDSLPDFAQKRKRAAAAAASAAADYTHRQ